ncbi:hypothetical protein ACFY9S_30320 [Streptomyces sp. NPDC012474]|uniref:hypothetical protein n=1 Tax=Streptomyces sp. NPDC012474 TaxID=3364836 RepID=UPI0036E42B42
MTRTAHHLPASRSRSAPDRSPGDPWRSVILYDLRYSARTLTDAVRQSRRPQPRKVRRTVAIYSFPRHQRDRSVAEWSATEERRARQRLRAQVGALLRMVNSTADELALRAVDTMDIVPARHRRGSLWLA